MEDIFLTTFYSLYFSQQWTHIFHRLQFLVGPLRAVLHVLHQLLCPFWLVVGTPSSCCITVLSLCAESHVDLSDSHQLSLVRGHHPEVLCFCDASPFKMRDFRFWHLVREKHQILNNLALCRLILSNYLIPGVNEARAGSAFVDKHPGEKLVNPDIRQILGNKDFLRRSLNKNGLKFTFLILLSISPFLSL